MEVHRKFLVCLTLFSVCVSFKNVFSAPVFSMEIDGPGDINDYLLKRQQVLIAEKHKRVGGEIVLTPDEMIVNDKLMNLKKMEVEESLNNSQPFAPSMSFLLSKPVVEQSAIFKLIQTMPKGGALHLHDVSMVHVDWLVQNVTYRDHCYMCYDKNNAISFHFYQTPPTNPGCPWKLVSEYRSAAPDAAKFDEMLRDSMVLTKDYVDRDINTVWVRFLDVLGRASQLLDYEPVMRDYYYQAMKEFYEDNVQYLENRALLGPIYGLDGTAHDAEYVLQLNINVTKQFKQDHPDFTGMRVIRTSVRFKSEADILTDIKSSIDLLKKYPDYFAGYDLVGQEDPGKPLLTYISDLLYPSQQHPPATLPYFFHAGETDWQGTRVDDNLIDALLLNTSRIGHGYAVSKHPEVMQMIKDKDVAIEVNPISNQVLKLVDDLRNHPAAGLIAQGFPIVISSDDPTYWGAKGLSYDFYMAFMGLSGKDDGLSLLKQLALNSLEYSSLPMSQRVAAVKLWKTKWNAFIQSALKML